MKKQYIITIMLVCNGQQILGIIPSSMAEQIAQFYEREGKTELAKAQRESNAFADYARSQRGSKIVSASADAPKKPESVTMKLRTFKQDKLWRDKIIAIAEQRGSKVHWQYLDDGEFLKQLKAKFMEEAHEVHGATNKEALLEELADVLEVMHALCAVYQCSLDDVITIQQKKLQERGGFESRKLVTTVEHPVGSWGEQYCLADPEKYPEV